MIQSITMKNVANYSKEGSSLEEMSKVNMIYGNNGSGKTTISQYLSHLDDPKYKDCHIEGDSNYEIAVYNRYYRDENIAKSNIPGVVTVGKEYVEIVRKIEDHQKEIEEYKKQYNQSISVFKQLENELAFYRNTASDMVWTSFQKNDPIIKEAFKGCLHSKSKYFDALFEHSKHKIHQEINKEELINDANMIMNQNLESVSSIDYIDHQKFVELNEIFERPYWEIPYAKEDDEFLYEDMMGDYYNWYVTGLYFYRSNRKKRICPFCKEPTISDELYERYSRLINKEAIEYRNQSEEDESIGFKLINHIKEQLNLILDTMKQNPFIDYPIQEMEDIIKEFVNDIDDRLQIQIERRIWNPDVTFTRDSILPIEDKLNKIIDLANERIKAYNDRINYYRNQKDEFIILMKDCMVLENEAILKEYKKNYNNIKAQMNELSKQSDLSHDHIKILEKEIVDLKLQSRDQSLQDTIKSINKKLSNAGFKSFELTQSTEVPFSFQLTRENGELVEHTLSEGEETLIAFLYFMEMIKEKGEYKKIIVIDDPISSLDSNMVYYVSQIICNSILKLKEEDSIYEQFIVLTHNVYFYKEINSHLRISKNMLRYYTIEKINKVSQIKSYNTDPIVSSNRKLWLDYKNKDNHDLNNKANTMRKILENYFEGWDSWKRKIESCFEEDEKDEVEMLFNFLNDGSHCTYDSCYMQDPMDMMEVYDRIFKEIFERTGNSGYYHMMMGEPK